MVGEILFKMEKSFQNLLDRFVRLGGIAENICLRKGRLGRGIFPLDSLQRARIFTPKNLLINRGDVCISHDEIYVKGSSRFSSREKNFIENYYNFAWKDGGNDCSSEFLKYVSAIPETVKSQLLDCGFIDSVSLNRCLDEKGVYKRFIDERVIRFEDNSVLAPVWDLVNHSSFAPSIRVSPHGVETPPIEPGLEEILHKYSEKK